ncbi:hypothetical protein DPEC_G00295260 [Dallia pectoralis]|uniref:Uncharacterized protein n=1 Tax=Dallia pectoralis TaxID=75939 RepID=A0ACC2FIN2_DALPE|nr:hypothetical protein DPEC_G00295260 [Dallia pectoralis]
METDYGDNTTNRSWREMAPPPTSSSINLSHLTPAPVGTVIPIKRFQELLPFHGPEEHAKCLQLLPC